MEVLNLCSPPEHFCILLIYLNENLILVCHNKMASYNRFEEYEFFLHEKGGKYLVIDCLFMTLYNIKPWNNYRLNSEFILDTKGYNVGKTGQSCTQVILDCEEVSNWEKLYLCSKPQLCILWNWYCFCSMWLERASRQNQKLTVTTAKWTLSSSYYRVSDCDWFTQNYVLLTVHKKVKSGRLSCSVLLVATT